MPSPEIMTPMDRVLELKASEPPDIDWSKYSLKPKPPDPDFDNTAGYNEGALGGYDPSDPVNTIPLPRHAQLPRNPAHVLQKLPLRVR